MSRRMTAYAPSVCSRGWAHAYSAVRGRSHRSSGAPCQDSALVRCRYGVTVATLADGAGSARHSDVGSCSCVEVAAKLFVRKFDIYWGMQEKALQVEVLSHVLEALRKNCVADGELRDYASTLLVVAVRGNRYICLHLGDGVIGIQYTSRNGVRRSQVLSTPENGEFINETVFTTSIDAREHLRVYRGRLDNREERTTGLILMSDGPESALYKANAQALAPACEKLLSACRRLPPLAMGERLDATTQMLADKVTQDDCSMVLLAR